MGSPAPSDEVEGSSPSPSTNRTRASVTIADAVLPFPDQCFLAGVGKEDKLVHDEDEAPPGQESSGGPSHQPIGAR